MRNIKQSEPLKKDMGGFINGSGMGIDTLGKTLKFDHKVSFRHKPYANDIKQVKEEILREEEEKAKKRAELYSEQACEVSVCG